MFEVTKMKTQEDKSGNTLVLPYQTEFITRDASLESE